MDGNTVRRQDLERPPVGDQKFHIGGGTRAVDQDTDFVAALKRQVLQDVLQHFVDQLSVGTIFSRQTPASP